MIALEHPSTALVLFGNPSLSLQTRDLFSGPFLPSAPPAAARPPEDDARSGPPPGDRGVETIHAAGGAGSPPLPPEYWIG